MTTITRSNNVQRLRLVSAEEALATGTTVAQQLLAETFTADEIRTPADALYSALVEFIALANDNRSEECDARLKGFCEVMGPALLRAQAVNINTQPDKPRRLSMRESNEAYAAGSANGRQAADEWLSNPHRGDPKRGGTLQYVMLDLAERMLNAQTEEEITRTRGEIVGFCYRVECPADSIACAEALAKSARR